jgi:muconolactone D-isomerase
MITISEYLVHIQISLPDTMSDIEHKALYDAEAEHCKSELCLPLLRRLWRVPGTKDNYGLWEAASPTQLHEAIASFPLFRYMTVTVIPLAVNPNDPALGRVAQPALHDAHAVDDGYMGSALVRP